MDVIVANTTGGEGIKKEVFSFEKILLSVHSALWVLALHTYHSKN